MANDSPSTSSVVSDSPSMSSRVSDSLSNDVDSPASSIKDPQLLRDMSDGEFIAKAYAAELLECGLKEERFRIDRKKLEDMLQTQQNPGSTVENAEVFFQRVMLETSTQISWPSKLKIGAKSKKDPHVKIVGKPEAVQMAKEKILEILDTKKNRVTLKMDVSHSDHSYIIGKGGFKIQQVMEETGCHIHFPDSNRNSTAEKSNQVSIAGQANGVELARAKIRDLLPLVFTFELPNGKTVNPGEECSPAIQHIQQTYSFNVAFRSIGPLGMGRTLLEVRGCQRLLSRLRQGLALLMEFLTGSKTIPVMGFMKTEIAAQHHQFVMGPCNANIQMITNKTGATITFPDFCPSLYGSDSPTAQPAPLIAGHSILRTKSTVLIQGSFDSVCLAWQELLKCLPLVLMFNLKEGQELDPVMMNRFMETFNINIMVRPKTKENTKSVLVRGAEKDCEILFQVRKDILGLEEDDWTVESPSKSSFNVPILKSYSRMRPPMESREQMQRQVTSNLTTAESLSLLTNIIQQNPQIVGLLNNLSLTSPAVKTGEAVPPTMPNPVYQRQVVHNPGPLNYPVKKDVERWINRPDTSYAFPAGSNTQNYVQRDRQTTADEGDSGIFIPSHINKFMNNGYETRSDLSSQHESSASSTSSNDTPDYKNSNVFRKSTRNKEQSFNSNVHQLLADYGNKKITANKAMQQPIGDGVRTPTHMWSGYGFSKSMPDFAARAAQRQAQNTGSISEYLELNDKALGVGAQTTKGWNTDSVDKGDGPLEQVQSPFSLSNFWENIPQQSTINYSSIKNLEQLFNLLDLQKYYDVFLHHEIDLITFLTLTDIDLQQLNISYGARRKMLTAIAAIRDQKIGDWTMKNFRAAPGAERRGLYSRYSTTSLTDENV
ncbi:protein bicaudal C homolog 1-like [Uloborus diversus]|uniref:protein bicaudal C homolog 1-like n=1 Tax=Uloborus diversus TaxID=327109 RepID=UPI002409C9BC|nr:protein bicaudal C homolog 1-like [Uloborus diversus]